MFDIITIGTATRDVFIKSHLFRVLRDPRHLEGLGFKTGEAECFALGAKVEIEKPTLTIGGGAVNSAVTFARQGFKTACLAKIGNDDSGAAILKELKKEKIQNLTVIDKIHGTAYSVILLSAEGERTILNYKGASENLAKKDIPFAKLKAKWVYIAPGNIPYEIMKLIVKYLKKNKTKIAMNPSKSYLSIGSKKLKPLLDNLDVVSLNREEATYLTGVDYKNEKELFRGLDELIKGIVVMTDGPRGVMVSDGENIYQSGTFQEKKLVDRTGAGDAFGSGFVAGLIKTKDIREAIRFATANATSVVEQYGATQGILRSKEIQVERFRELEIKSELLR